jgi:hypothetical protein
LVARSLAVEWPSLGLDLRGLEVTLSKIEFVSPSLVRHPVET